MTELTLQSPSIFVKTLGSVPAIRIIDFLIENRRDSWSMTEIAQQGGIAYPSVKYAMPQLVTAGLVVVTRKVGRIPLYAISSTSSAKKLIELHKEVILQSMHKQHSAFAKKSQSTIILSHA